MIGLENKNPNDLVYPHMFMVACEDVEIDPKIFHLGSAFDQTLGMSRFGVNLSIYREGLDGVFNLVCGIINTKFPSVLPQFKTLQVTDINSLEAKQFLESIISCFKPFKKAIMTFESRPYTVGEFNSYMDNWKDDLNKNQK